MTELDEADRGLVIERVRASAWPSDTARALLEGADEMLRACERLGAAVPEETRQRIVDVRLEVQALRPALPAVVHGMTGFGSDWPVGSVVETVEQARSVAWIDHPLDHDLLVVRADGSSVCFDVKREG